MKFALLGVDAETLALAQEIAESSAHELVWACDVAGAEAELRQMAPRVQIAKFWESLLAGSVADAVIVARAVNQDERADQLRKLVQAPVPLILSHPVHESMLVCYELDMIRRESQCLMLPMIPYRWHAGTQRLSALVAAGASSEIGPAEQVIMERALGERTRPLVMRQFAADVALLRMLCGDLTSVSALAPGGQDAADYAKLGVQLAGVHGLLARWSVAPVEHTAGATIVVRGSAGRAKMDLPIAGQPTELELTIAGQTRRESFPAWSPAEAAIVQFTAATASREPTPSWPDGCRDVELAEAIPRSLAKARTIELHDEEHSEHGTFKGTMTSVGCGLLVASLVVLIVAAALAKITGQPIFGYAPYFILGMLGLFLLMQSLKLVFPSQD